MSILFASNVDFTNIGMDSVMKPANFAFTIVLGLNEKPT